MKKIIYLFIILCSFNFVEAQTDIINNLDKLKGDGSSPNSQNNGIHTTNIPLHTFQGRELDLPISLSYTASGIKVSQVASTVGLGWSLNVGGKIERVVSGHPDGNTIENQNPCSNLNNLNGDQEYTLRDYFNVNANGFYDIINFPIHDDNDNDSPGWPEQAPVTHVFKKCLINSDNKVITTNTAMGIAYPWIVNEANGTQYFFGENSCKEKIFSLNGDFNPNNNCENVALDYDTSWMLTKMISKNGLDEYTFVYEAFEWDSYISQAKEGKNSTVYNSSYKLKQQMIKEVWHNGSKIVSFEYGTRNDLSFVGGSTVGNSLNTIYFYNFKSTTPYKKISFGHDYFGDTNLTAPKINRRLMLTNIVNYSIDSSNNELAGDSYSFEYENPQNVPPLNSNAQDYLGLYNGQNSNTHLVPNYGANRTFNLNFAKNGTLKKITYPNKGFSEFEYDQNSRFSPGEYYVPAVVHFSHYNYYNLLNLSFEYYCDSPLIPEKYRIKNPNMNTFLYNNFPDYPHTNLAYIGNNIEIGFFDLSNKTSNTLCRINTSGHGLYAILKLEDCSLPDQTNDYCEDEIIENYYGCAIDTRDIYYTSTASSHNFISAGITDSQPTSEINLAPGKYQVILWDINYFELTDPSIIIEEQGEAVYDTIPGYYSQINSQPKDGFRIKSITNYSKENVFANKKLYSYADGESQDVNNTYTQYNTPSSYTNYFLSRGYTNAPNILQYGSVCEQNIDAQGFSLGSICSYFDVDVVYGGFPFNFGSDPREVSLPTFTYGNKNTLKKVEYYSTSGIQKREEFFYGNDETEYETCYTCVFDDQINTQLGRIKTTAFLDSENSTIETNKYFIYTNGSSPNSQILAKTVNEKNNILYEHENAFLGTAGYNYAVKLGATWVCNSDYSNCINTKYINTTLSGQLNGNPINRYLTTEIQTSQNNDPLEPKTRFEYDTDGNMVSTVQVTPGNIANNQWDSFIYGYDNRFVVAKLTGIKYSDIPPALINDIKAASNQAITPASITAMETYLNALRNSTDVNVQNAQITTYTYNPVFGVTSLTDPKGMTIYTEYDAFGRVKLTKEKAPDGSLKILSENQYNTRPN